jgi:hypothetical protein
VNRKTLSSNQVDGPRYQHVVNFSDGDRLNAEAQQNYLKRSAEHFSRKSRTYPRSDTRHEHHPQWLGENEEQLSPLWKDVPNLLREGDSESRMKKKREKADMRAPLIRRPSPKIGRRGAF